MRTVKSLMETLAKFPADAQCHAYEGEVIGIVIRSGRRSGRAELGAIVCEGGEQQDSKVLLRGDDGNLYEYTDDELPGSKPPPSAPVSPQK